MVDGDYSAQHHDPTPSRPATFIDGQTIGAAPEVREGADLSAEFTYPNTANTGSERLRAPAPQRRTAGLRKLRR